jgi:hypothetical protein
MVFCCWNIKAINKDSGEHCGPLVLNASAYSSLSRHSASILLNKLAFGLRNAYSKPFHDSTSFASIFSLSLSVVTGYNEYERWKIIRIDSSIV